jgi:hypothetical protein
MGVRNPRVGALSVRSDDRFDGNFSVLTWPLYLKVVVPDIPAEMLSSFFDSSGYLFAE